MPKVAQLGSQLSLDSDVSLVDSLTALVNREELV